jgi:hypothetical protein
LIAEAEPVHRWQSPADAMRVDRKSDRLPPNFEITE